MIRNLRLERISNKSYLLPCLIIKCPTNSKAVQNAILYTIFLCQPNFISLFCNQSETPYHIHRTEYNNILQTLFQTPFEIICCKIFRYQHLKQNAHKKSKSKNKYNWFGKKSAKLRLLKISRPRLNSPLLHFIFHSSLLISLINTFEISHLSPNCQIMRRHLLV